MFLQGWYAALLSWRNSHVGSTWSWYMMWSGEIFFRSLERLNFLSVWPLSVDGDLSDRINLPIAIMRSCYFADRDVRDRINSPIAIYAIVLFRWSRFTWSCYFADRDLRNCVILSIAIYMIVLFLVGPGFEPRPNVRSFLLVLGSIPRPDRLFQGSVIHGLCHSPQQMVN